MSHASTSVTFHLTCPEPRAWLVVKSDNPRVCVVQEMQRRQPGIWSTCMELTPGDYRCRHYCGDERRVIYHGPAHTDGGIVSGMDTLVSVRSPQEEQTARFTHRSTEAGDSMAQGFQLRGKIPRGSFNTGSRQGKGGPPITETINGIPAAVYGTGAFCPGAFKEVW